MSVAFETVQGWERTGYLKKLIEYFHARGVVADFEAIGPTRVFVDQWNSEFEKLIRESGYQGGPIKKYSRFFCGQGTVDALYDSDRMSYEDVDILAYEYCLFDRVHDV